MLSEREDPVVSGIFALTPAESKRLIAKAVVQLPEVRRAWENGRVLVANGTTNSFVAAELLESDVSGFHYSAGLVCDGMLVATKKEERMLPYVFDKGQQVEIGVRDAVLQMGAQDVFIKGANAVDLEGHAGVLMADDKGGTIGTSLGVIAARGIKLICPVGLEKLVPSVVDASSKCGIGRFKHALGLQVGMMPLTNALVITEIEALEILTGVEATHVASGGMAGSEGAVVLVVEGSDEQVDRAVSLVKSIKAETKPVEKTGAVAW